MAKAVVAGYGPSDLLECLKRIQWVQAGRGARNFEGISIGGWVLTHPEDEGCCVKYRLTVERGAGETFEVEGYSVRTLLEEVGINQGIIRIFGHRLSTLSKSNSDTRYVLTMEIVEEHIVV